MKHLRRLFTAMLLLCATVASAYSFKYGGIYYKIKSAKYKTVEVTFKEDWGEGYYSDYKGNITIPQKVTYKGVSYKVTGIGDGAFYECYDLTSVKIPNSVTRIGEYAFFFCTGLTSVTIPGSVKTIDVNAFRSCSGLESITIPNSVTSIESFAFGDCSALTSVTIPNSVKKIGENAFYNCSNLKTVHINSLAAWCNISMDGPIFNNLYNLYIGGELASNIVIPDKITKIKPYTFFACESIVNLTIPNSVTSIGEGAFYECSALASVTIPNSVKNIGENAFYNCSNLKTVHINNLAAWCNISMDGPIFNNLYNLYIGGELASNIVIPDKITKIKPYTFFACESIVNLTIPNSVTTVGNSAFANCTALASVTIGKNVTSIGENAFRYCEALKTVMNFSNLTLDTYSSDNGYVAYYADAIMDFPNGNIEGDYIWCEIDGVNTLACYMGEASDLTLPANYKGGSYAIGNGAFYGDGPFYTMGLGSVTIPNGVTSIGDRAFMLCFGLTSVTIPSSVTSIGEDAFSGCSGLASITIPASVANIGNSAFYGCSNLKKVLNFSNLKFSKGSSEYGQVARYADEVINLPNGCIDGDFAWCKIDGVNTLACYFGDASELTLPADYKGESYVIGEGAFNACTSLASITIPNSVTNIGKGAFSDCTGLTAVHISDLSAWYNVSFGDNSANPLHCAKNLYLNGELVTELVIPDGVTKIGDYSFSGCSGLASITIPNSVTNIGKGAFNGCTGLTAVHISDLSAWYNVSFGDNSANPLHCAKNLYLNGELVTELVIPDGVTKIGDYAFSGCKNLASITIPACVANIGNSAFNECSNLKKVVNFSNLKFSKGSSDHGQVARYAEDVINLPNGCIDGDFIWDKIDGVNVLARYFGDASELTLPADYKGESYVIGEGAFNACTSLTSITIPNSVTNIGKGAFNACTGLTAVYISDLSAWYNVSFGDNSANPLHCAKNLYLNGELVTELVIPDGVTKIGDYSFSGCSGLASITIPNSVTNIGKGAFNGCTGLTAVYISDLSAWYNVSFGDKSANPLCYAKNLYLNGELVTELVIPDGVTKIGDYSFSGCSGLASITIPNSVTNIGKGAFNGCTGLTAVHISNLSAWCNVSFGDNSANPLHCAKNLYLNGELVTELVIPDGVTKIGDYSFSGCSGLTNIIIPDGVTSIEEGAFEGCTGLTSITIPNSVANIGNRAFDSCTGLKKVEINCASVEKWFSGLSSIQEIVLGNNVRKIGSYAFQNCTGLTSVIIPNSVSSIGNGAFQNCTGLKKVEINCASVEKWFSGLPSIQEIVLGNDVRKIGSYAFQNCTGLTSVVIPSNVTSIGDDAFTGCTGIKKAINCSNLILTSSWWGYGGVYVPADKIINAPNCSVEGDFIWVKIYGVNILACYFGDASELTLPADYKGESYVIGEGAFNACTSLTSITIPAGVTNIDNSAFNGCSNLKKVLNFSNLKFIKGSSDYGQVAQYADKVINVPNGCIDGDFAWCRIDGVNTLAGYLGNATELTLPANYKGGSYVIGSFAFSDCENLTSVVISDGVTSIGYSAFSDCENLTSVVIGNSVKSIGKFAFSGCENLTSVVIGDSVTIICEYAFSDCSGLTCITIPNSVTGIGYGAFGGCINLKTIINYSKLTLIKGQWDYGSVAQYAEEIINKQSE